MLSKQEKLSTYNLITGEDTYAGQNAQRPDTSRRVLSFIPEDDGQLYREWADPKYLGNAVSALTGEIVLLYQFDWRNVSGTLTRTWFAVAATSFGGTTYRLYSQTGSATSGSWTLVAAVATLQNIPIFSRVPATSNLLHLSDGVTSYLFDGSNWVIEGFVIPQGAPALSATNVWFPTFNALSTKPDFLIDSNGNVQLCTASGTTGSATPKWATAVGATTTDGTVTWTCLGLGGVAWQPSTVYPMNACVLDSNLNYQRVTTNGTSGTTQPNWQAKTGNTTADNTVTWTDIGSPSGDFLYTGPLLANGAWEGNTSYSVRNIIIDFNGNVQIANNNGTSGNTVPAWAVSIGTTTTDNSVTWLCKGPLLTFPKWQASTAYPAGSVIKDSNNNFQYTVAGGTSGTTQPSNWSSNFSGGGTTIDNGITWIAISTNKSGQGIISGTGRYYWTSVADATVGRTHESDSTPISLISGPMFGNSVAVFQQPGLFTSSNVSKTITTSLSLDIPGPRNANITPDMVGKVIYINGVLIGTIASVNSSTGTLTLVANATLTKLNQHAVIVDARATHWHVYASESDGSKVGQYLATVPVTQDLDSSPFVDNSPPITLPQSLFLPIFRPVRNDPPLPSQIMTAHKYRIFRRNEVQQQLFNFSANEEVSTNANGDPEECVPGVQVNTISDIINEVPYPEISNYIRNMTSHADALWIFSEKQCLPLYGSSIDDFGISQISAFAMGAAGRFSAKSTPHGLAFVAYDRKIQLYPISFYPWSQYSRDLQITDQLMEIGKPLRTKLELISFANLDKVRVEFYNFGRRNWLVVCWLDNTNKYNTWVYDFYTKKWFQLAKGVVSLAVFEISDGMQILVGGGSDGFVYVLDDITGTFSGSGNQPNSIWRTSLIDYGDPDSNHITVWVDIEFSNPAMANDMTINFYIDPQTADSLPATPDGTAILRPLIVGGNQNSSKKTGLYRAAFGQGGALAHRILVEFNMAPSTNVGVIRGVKLVARKVSGVLP